MWPAAAPRVVATAGAAHPDGPGELARLQPTELSVRDCHGHEARFPPGPLRHYTYAGCQVSGKWRLLEMPKARLKAIQRASS